MKRTIVPKKEQILLENSAMADLLKTIYDYPEIEFSLSELAGRAGVSKSTASRLLSKLEQFEMVTVINKGIILRIKANVESFQFVKRKIAHNLATIYESGIVEYLDTILRHPKAIILTGSFRLGQDRSDSDIDLAVETSEPIHEGSIRPERIDEFERLLGRRIQIFRFNRDSISTDLFNNIANGIVLVGLLEVSK